MRMCLPKAKRASWTLQNFGLKTNYVTLQLTDELDPESINHRTTDNVQPLFESVSLVRKIHIELSQEKKTFVLGD